MAEILRASPAALRLRLPDQLLDPASNRAGSIARLTSATLSHERSFAALLEKW